MQRVPHHFGPSPRLHCRYMNELIDSFRCGIDRQHHVKYMAETHGGYFKCRGIIQPNNAHCLLPMLDSIFFFERSSVYYKKNRVLGALQCPNTALSQDDSQRQGKQSNYSRRM
jgi:hypothetical protein